VNKGDTGILARLRTRTVDRSLARLRARARDALRTRRMNVSRGDPPNRSDGVRSRCIYVTSRTSTTDRERKKSCARRREAKIISLFFSLRSAYVSHVLVSHFPRSLSPSREDNANGVHTRGRRSGETAVGGVRERPGGGQRRE